MSAQNASTGFQLIAFSVKPNASGTFSGGSGDIGWGRGNSDKGWHEGAWIPVKIIVSNVQTNYPGLVGFPTINLRYDFTNGGNRFIDLIRDIQIGTTTTATDSSGNPIPDAWGWPETNGTITPLDASPFPETNLTQVETAQDSVGEGVWPGFTLAETLSGWSSTSRVNVPYTGGNGTPTDGSHEFTITAAQINAWATATGNLNANTITIYCQMHLARTFIWSNGLESGYSTSGSITYAEGGWLYGTTAYTGASADKRDGSGFVSGSSGHMYFNMTGIGADTTQLPVPPQPAGTISGLKWQDSNNDGLLDNGETTLSNWGIHLSATLEGGISFSAETFTDANGNYTFSNLTQGTWTVAEHLWQGPPPQGTPQRGWKLFHRQLTLAVQLELVLRG